MRIADNELQLGPVEGSDHLDHVLHGQCVPNDGADLRCGGSGEGSERRARADVLEQARQVEEIRPKTGSPHRDAVGLVNNNLNDARGAQRLQQMRIAQALWRNIHQPDLTRTHTGEGFLALVGRLAAVDGGDDLDPSSLQRLHLVAHEGDKRRKDQGDPIAQEGSKLETERLPRPRGEECQDIAPGEHLLDDFLLLGAAKPGEAEDVL